MLQVWPQKLFCDPQPHMYVCPAEVKRNVYAELSFLAVLSGISMYIKWKQARVFPCLLKKLLS